MTRARDIADVGYKDELVDDTTPQLSGDLDLNSNAITGNGSVNIGVSGNSIFTSTGTFAGLQVKSTQFTDLELQDTTNDYSFIMSNRGNETFEILSRDFSSGSNVYSVRLKIDGSSGSVLALNQPMFMADMRGNGTVNSSGVLPFSNVRLNNGGHYNTTNRRFTAPIAGKYMFQYGFLVRNAVMSSRLQVNGSDTASGRTGYCDCLSSLGNINLEIMAVGSEILSLSANDYVHVHMSFHGGQDIYAEDISHFHGFLIG